MKEKLWMWQTTAADGGNMLEYLESNQNLSGS
jgi:hypothetical protein